MPCSAVTLTNEFVLRSATIEKKRKCNVDRLRNIALFMLTLCKFQTRKYVNLNAWHDQRGK